MNNNSKKRCRKAIFWLIILVTFLIMLLISIIVNKNIIVNKKIETAKKEAKQTLLSSGLLVKKNNEEATEKNKINLTENTTSNPQTVGTKVKEKENWNIETITAISVGNGETVPVPKGFYYVGGNLSTGVIISDEEEDKYDGQTDKTTWEYTTSLKGNQFVWIPCTEEEYVKSDSWNGLEQKPGTLAHAGWDKTTYSSELLQIRKYGGFYVARYEAGLAKNIEEVKTTIYYPSTKSVYNKEGIPQSKAGIVPWNFIDWSTANKNAKNMYNVNSVNSGLINGTQWDVMLKKMVEKTDLTEEDLIGQGSKIWGNYMENSINYTGRKSTEYVSGSGHVVLPFGEVETNKTTVYSGNNGDLLTTGASSQTEVYHIFDVAGNLSEFTEEKSLYHPNANQTDIPYFENRGGNYAYKDSLEPACYRGLIDTTYNYFALGFRVVLYMK